MRRRREIFIELTSLLDVIFIMLFVVLTQARTQTAQAISDAEADREAALRLEEQAEALRQDNIALQEQVGEARRQLLTQDLVLDNSLVLTISIREDFAIRLEAEGEEPQLIPYDWDQENYAHNALRATLNTALRETDREAVFLVFQYEKIYEQEYQMIEALLREAKLEAKQRELPLTVLELDSHG